MLRLLTLLATLGSAAAGAVSCSGAATVKSVVCDQNNVDDYTPTGDPTQLTGSAWNCAATELIIGLSVPVLVDVTNACANANENPPELVTAKSKVGEYVDVYFACSSSTCGNPPAALSGVLVWNNLYVPKLAGTSFAATGAVGVAVQGRLTIGTETAFDKGEKIILGVIYTRSNAYPSFSANPEATIYIFADASGNFMTITDLAQCVEASGSGQGSTTAKFLSSPPPPPPPPDCCTDFSRQCLARCNQCELPGAMATDAKGVACAGYCDINCPLYPTQDSKTCFNRCSDCAKGTVTVDAEGQACTLFCESASCSAYTRCMAGGKCVVGCVNGRRERKLLFAPIPVCADCCEPAVN